MLARLLTVLTLVAAYVAAQLAISAVRSGGGWLPAALGCAAGAGVLLVPVLVLRSRRRAGAAGVVAVVSRFAPRQTWRRPVFLAVRGAGYALFAGGWFMVSSAQQQGYKWALAAQILLLPAGLVLLGAGFLILRYARPRSARGAAQALLADGREPVLYLRSFTDDESAAVVDDGAAVNLHSREEQLAAALGAVGPVIAVGRPEEPLPRLGAARFTVRKDDDWQDVVLRLMGLSQLIVLRLGLGDGVWWEVKQALALPVPKLMLLVPGGLPEVAARLREVVPGLELTSGDSWIATVVVFEPDWTPVARQVGRARRGWFTRRFGWAWMTVHTPAYDVAWSMKSALASVGIRKRSMGVRALYALQQALWTGLLLVTVVFLTGWLVFRALQLFGIW